MSDLTQLKIEKAALHFKIQLASAALLYETQTDSNYVFMATRHLPAFIANATL